MNALDDDIRKALERGESPYDLDLEEGVFRQLTGLFRGKLRWWVTLVMVESIVFSVLIVLAAIEFFQADETKWQIFYASSVLLLGMLILLVKLWSWGQMNRYSIQREIKRLELCILELREQQGS